MGYSRAGFDDITGVDIKPQPRYPFKFIQADAMTFTLDGYDLIHASPPCQAFTSISVRWRGKGTRADERIDLLTPTRARLAALSIPWIIENVIGARSKMNHSIRLHGGMFGLGVHRPRLFESNVMLFGFDAAIKRNAVCVYGKMDGRRLWSRKDGSELRAPRTLDQASVAMGIDWMIWDELRESIPPAYTEYIGRQLMAQLAN